MVGDLNQNQDVHCVVLMVGDTVNLNRIHNIHFHVLAVPYTVGLDRIQTVHFVVPAVGDDVGLDEIVQLFVQEFQVLLVYIRCKNPLGSLRLCILPKENTNYNN